MILAMAKKGGVIQINFDCAYLNPDAAAAEAAETAALAPVVADLRSRYKNDAEARRNYTGPKPHATIADVVKHINHVADIAGISAIGLGSDFDGVSCVPEGLDGVDKWPNLTRALLEEGYSKDDIVRIYGGNPLRLMTEVEQTAERIKNEIH
jgi:membrane dipeptidase